MASCPSRFVLTWLILHGSDPSAAVASFRLPERQLHIANKERWSRLSEPFFRVDKWSVCRG
jgi:hypothetical protein